MFTRLTGLVSMLGFAILAACHATSTVRADGLILKLPADGTQVEFKVKAEGTPAPPEGFKMTIRLSSVGTVQHDGKTCRWIELGVIVDVDGIAADQHYKFLVPEDELKQGGNPAANIIKSYKKYGDENAVEDKDVTNPLLSPIPVFFGGPLKDVKQLDKVKIKSGLGELECPGTIGIYEREKDGNSIKSTLTTRTHDKAPFGVAQASIEFKIKKGDNVETGIMTLTLDKVSAGAKSAIPEVK